MSVYSDFPYDLEINEFGDVDLIEDSAAIKQSLQTIILTRIGAKMIYQQPIFGSATADLLFEKLNPFTLSNLEEEVTFAIENWEPRVEITLINIDSDTQQQQIKVSITYKVINLNITDQIVIDLSVLS